MATESPSDDIQGSRLETHLVNRLMDRHGVPQRQRHASLEAVGMSYQQARRRMSGIVPWTLEELRTVAEHFGETLQTLLGDVSVSPGLKAELIVGPLRIPCTLWVGDEPKLTRPGPLVATRTTQDEWLVVPAGEAATTPSYEVKRLVIQPEERAPKRVGVLDDDRDTAQAIADYMTTVGVYATPFFSIGALSAAVAAQPFDGYVLDWLVNRENARSLIAGIRAQDAHCPIIVLTGQMKEGKVDESEMSAVSASHRVTYLEKPQRPSSLLSFLDAGFERRSNA